MVLTVHFMAQLKSAAGTPSIQVDVGESATMKDVAAKAAERCGNSLRTILLDDKGAPRSGVLAFCGDQQVGWDDAVKGAAEVTLLSGMSGG
jgi:molybdopterin converting factor small subunit